MILWVQNYYIPHFGDDEFLDSTIHYISAHSTSLSKLASALVRLTDLIVFLTSFSRRKYLSRTSGNRVTNSFNGENKGNYRSIKYCVRIV